MPPFEATKSCLGKDVTFFESASHIGFFWFSFISKLGDPMIPVLAPVSTNTTPFVQSVNARQKFNWLSVLLLQLPQLYSIFQVSKLSQYGYHKYAPNPYEVPQ